MIPEALLKFDPGVVDVPLYWGNLIPGMVAVTPELGLIPEALLQFEPWSGSCSL